MCPSVLLLTLCPLVLAGRMEVLYSWSQVDLTFPSDSARKHAIESAQFIPVHNLVLDVDVWEGRRRRTVIVTLPKLKPGTPVTLATVTDQRHNGTTLLRPYPDWSWHEGDCTGITSVFRTRVDQCGRLWVLDSGTVDIFSHPRRICPPQLLVFDLNTDRLLKRFRFPANTLDEDSLLITVAVDTRLADCSDAMAYVADVSSYKLLVYDSATDTAWRITSNLFYPWPLHGDFHINGKNFDLMDGLFGLALGPVGIDGDRILYFHALASVRLGWVYTAVVRNHSLFEEDEGAAQRAFHVFHESRPSQTAAQDMTDSGVLLYAQLEENAIGCWNTHQPFRRQNMDVATKDDTTLQFQSGLKVYGDRVWSLSSRLQNYIVGQVAEHEVNYRVNVGRVSDLLSRTRCQQQQTNNLQLLFLHDGP